MTKDRKTAKKSSDRRKMGSEPYEVAYFAKKHGMSVGEARHLAKKHGVSFTVRNRDGSTGIAVTSPSTARAIKRAAKTYHRALKELADE